MSLGELSANGNYPETGIWEVTNLVHPKGAEKSY